ncbi:DMT family transporter [Pelagovum sp. HNIBRBA483]|uniref:DMT family transporter n=1 Tax=Pelagovum sp. HNIBRBA483 TaxID=3233341 RepID=UPI0034A1F5FA
MTDHAIIPKPPLIGMFWMLVAGLNFVAVTALVKAIVSDVPAAQAAFIRYALGLLFIVPMIRAMRGTRVTARAFRVFVSRGLFHAFAVILWFFAMARIPIAEVTALNYLNPVYVTVVAALFLGEGIAARRLLAVAAAFIGALVVLRPGLRELEAGHIAMLGTAVLFAGSYLLAKRLSAEFSAAVIVGYLSMIVTVILFPFAWAVWVTPSWHDLGGLFLVALFATAGHYTMTLAFAAAPLSVTQPVTFLQLVWASLLGWLIFDEGLDPFVIFGGGLIVAAVSFITWREAVSARKNRSTAL